MVVALVIGLVIVLFVRLLTGGTSSGERQQLRREEAETVQELDKALRSMDQRLESLETILTRQSKDS